MARIDAATPEEYLAALPDDRRAVVSAVRDVVRANLPEGYQEVVGSGMLGYVIPLSRYPKTYNKQPLQYAALAAQKGHYALYLVAPYQDPAHDAWFREAFAAAGKTLDMGKSCVRFKRLEDLPLDVVARSIARVAPDDFIAQHEAARAR